MDDLLDGMLDIVIAEMEVPRVGAPWRPAMRRRAISAHRALLRHAWACPLMGSRIDVGPALLRHIHATVGNLREAGFSIETALDAWHTLDGHIDGFTLKTLDLPLDAGAPSEIAAALLPHVSRQTPSFREVVATIAASGRLERFEFGLDLLLEGLEREMAAG